MKSQHKTSLVLLALGVVLLFAVRRAIRARQDDVESYLHAEEGIGEHVWLDDDTAAAAADDNDGNGSYDDDDDDDGDDDDDDDNDPKLTEADHSNSNGKHSHNSENSAHNASPVTPRHHRVSTTLDQCSIANIDKITLHQRLQCTLQTIAINKTVIVTAVSIGFKAGFVNWLVFLRRLGLASNVLVLAMDDDILKFSRDELRIAAFSLSDVDNNAFDIASKGLRRNKVRRNGVWTCRTALILDIILLGYSVVHSDVDALWLHDPLPELWQLRDAGEGLIMSRAGRGQLCMGFFMANPAAGVQEFLQQSYSRQITFMENDQMSVNKMIFNETKKGELKEDVVDLWGGSCGKLMWTALPETRYLRLGGEWLHRPEEWNSSQIMIFHPTYSKLNRLPYYGWDVLYPDMPKILAEPDAAAVAKLSVPGATLRDVCDPMPWSERVSMNTEHALKCAQLWAVREDWRAPSDADSVDQWLDNVMVPVTKFTRAMTPVSGYMRVITEDLKKKEAAVNQGALQQQQQQELQQDGSIGPRPNSKCLASFFIIGARKGGTTSLYVYIAKHPDVRGVRLNAGAQAGELFYGWAAFNWKNTRQHTDPLDVLQRKGVESREEYNKLFTQNFRMTHTIFDPNTMLTGESTVQYNMMCHAHIAFMHTCGTDIRLIFLARNPVERMISVFLMRVRTQTKDKRRNLEYNDRLNINDVFLEILAEWNAQPRVKENKNWWREPNAQLCPLRGSPPYNDVWESMYYIHLMRWLRKYPRERLLVVKSETLFQQPVSVLEKVLPFLGLDKTKMDLGAVTSTVYNSRSSEQKDELPPAHILRPSVREKLNEVFRPLNEALEEEFGIDVSDWN